MNSAALAKKRAKRFRLFSLILRIDSAKSFAERDLEETHFCTHPPAFSKSVVNCRKDGVQANLCANHVAYRAAPVLEVVVEDVLRDLRRLSATGLATDDEHLGLLEGACNRKTNTAFVDSAAVRIPRAFCFGGLISKFVDLERKNL